MNNSTTNDKALYKVQWESKKTGKIARGNTLLPKQQASNIAKKLNKKYLCSNYTIIKEEQQNAQILQIEY